MHRPCSSITSRFRLGGFCSVFSLWVWIMLISSYMCIWVGQHMLNTGLLFSSRGKTHVWTLTEEETTAPKVTWGVLCLQLHTGSFGSGAILTSCDNLRWHFQCCGRKPTFLDQKKRGKNRKKYINAYQHEQMKWTIPVFFWSLLLWINHFWNWSLSSKNIVVIY